ncbi:hypothetical protein JXL21_14630 [Candidatus Bathyarchaeota archaeon]|nr:hypothetical protein [Candidatus Bathyarchaeota archaeon]
MSVFDKVEVMDFLINVLKDHEKSLDSLISRAEDVITENQEQAADSKKGLYDSAAVKVVLKDWSEFKSRLKKVELICFDIVDQVFIVSANTSKNVFEYREKTPELTLEMQSDKNIVITSSEKMEDGLPLLNSRLSIGLQLSYRKENVGEPDENKHQIIYDIDPQYTRKWLSDELNIHQDFIVCGDIEL